MRLLLALALLVTTVVSARVASSLLLPDPPGDDVVVVASLPPEPVPEIPDPDPASPPVYTPEIAPHDDATPPADQVAVDATAPPSAIKTPALKAQSVTPAVRRRRPTRRIIRPPVHLRWQSRVARMRDDTDWRDLAFGRL